MKMIDDESSPNSIKSWDSLKHMNLVTVLEEEFNVQFIDKEIIELLNYTAIISILNEKISQ